jgi:hypothetical protein
VSPFCRSKFQDSFSLEVDLRATYSAAQLLLPTSANSWIAHTQGVSNLMELASPELFIPGIYHKLFTGFPPGLASSSASHHLHREARHASSCVPGDLIKKSVGTFLDVLQRLNLRMQSFTAESPTPLFSRRPGDHDDLCIWFSNISIANYLTQFWGFRAVCPM